VRRGFGVRKRGVGGAGVRECGSAVVRYVHTCLLVVCVCMCTRWVAGTS